MKVKVERFYTDRSEGFINIVDKNKNIDITLKVWYYETSRTWGHKGTIIGHYDNKYATRNDFKITYYNRTWECYTFQSLIHQMIRGCGIALTDKQLKHLLDMVDKKARYVL